MEDERNSSPEHLRYHPYIVTRAKTAARLTTERSTQDENIHTKSVAQSHELILNSNVNGNVPSDHRYDYGDESCVPIGRNAEGDGMSPLSKYAQRIDANTFAICKGKIISKGFTVQDDNKTNKKTENMQKNAKFRSTEEEDGQTHRDISKRNNGDRQSKATVTDDSVVAARKAVVMRAKASKQECIAQKTLEEGNPSSWSKIWNRFFKPFKS